MENSAGFETTIGGAALLSLSYIIAGILIPAIIDVLVWRKLAGAASAWLNIITLAVFSITFFVCLMRVTQTKIPVFDNITPSGIMLAVGIAALFFLLLDKLLDPMFDKMFPDSANKYQDSLETLRKAPVAAFILICLFAQSRRSFCCGAMCLAACKTTMER